MKKIIYYSVLIILLVPFIVNAAEFSDEEYVDKIVTMLKEDEYLSSFGGENKYEVTSSDNNIRIEYSWETGSSNVNYFGYNLTVVDGILSYEYVENEKYWNEICSNRKIFIAITEIISNYYGYEWNEVQEWLTTIDSEGTETKIENNGIEYVYSIFNDTTSLNGTKYFSIYKISLKDGFGPFYSSSDEKLNNETDEDQNIKNENSVINNENEETEDTLSNTDFKQSEEKVDNPLNEIPPTGFNNYLIIILAISFTCILLFVFLKIKTKVFKL